MTHPQTYYIFDFDSTIITVEAIDLLTGICLKGKPKMLQISNEIKRITNLGMEGKIGFTESLTKRLTLIQPHRRHIDQLRHMLISMLTPSILRRVGFFKKNKKNIYIVTGGFREFVMPVARKLGIDERHVMANEFVYDKEGEFVTGYKTSNPLSQPKGKAKAILSLNLRGIVYMIGDGYTDYEAKKYGAADMFIAYTENIKRERAVSFADATATNFEELMKHLGLA